MRAATAEAYARLCPDDLSAKVAPGMVELLEALVARPDAFRLSLVTGNLEPVARLKLERAGVGRFFAAGQGGFGSDDEDRGRLPAIARGRASDPPWPRERTIVIGDTPRDIACARVDEVRVAAVATGPYAIEALADADAVVDDAHALLAGAYRLGLTTAADPPPRRLGSATATKVRRPLPPPLLAARPFGPPWPWPWPWPPWSP